MAIISVMRMQGLAKVVTYEHRHEEALALGGLLKKRVIV
jgi:hypothetical protein